MSATEMVLWWTMPVLPVAVLAVYVMRSRRYFWLGAALHALLPCSAVAVAVAYAVDNGVLGTGIPVLVAALVIFGSFALVRVMHFEFGAGRPRDDGAGRSGGVDGALSETRDPR